MMRNKFFRNYYVCAMVGVILASAWPLVMGVRVVRDMVVNGTVMGADYPKYIIPYLPISLAVICGVALMPLMLRWLKKYALPAASAISMGIFFASELLLENWVIITDTVETTLESWQMFMCYVSPESFETRTWRAVDVLIGEYSPTFKLHFYLIAIVLILAFLNCFYGFSQVILRGERKRLRHLICQSVATVLFLALCILACFTAFFRTGDILVSPLSAVLMSLFFIVFGVTMGIYTASFLTRCSRTVVIAVPTAISCIVTAMMYVGELFLLSGHLYRFGSGFLFDGLGALVLAPIDLLVILLSGAITLGLLMVISPERDRGIPPDQREN